MSDPFASSARAQRLLAASDDELFQLLGTELSGTQALPLSPAELIERGRRWFSAQEDMLRATVCINPRVKALTLENRDDLALAAALADVLASLVLPVTPVTLAALIVRRGLKTFCELHWTAA